MTEQLRWVDRGDTWELLTDQDAIAGCVCKHPDPAGTENAGRFGYYAAARSGEDTGGKATSFDNGAQLVILFLRRHGDDVPEIPEEP